MDYRLRILLLTITLTAAALFFSKRSKGRIGIFPDMFRVAGHVFSRQYLPVMAGAVFFTLVWIASGLDLALQQAFQRLIPLRAPWFRDLFRLGNYWHIVPAIALYLGGRLFRRRVIQAAGSAALQALFLTVWLTLVLKLLSGRRGPARFFGPRRHHSFRRTADVWDFRFDFWNHVRADGRFFWPSGHTSSIFAFVAALTAFFPEKKWVPLAGYPLAVAMGLFMTAGNFHWSSDVIAGALIGNTVGLAAGRQMRRRLDAG